MVNKALLKRKIGRVRQYIVELKNQKVTRQIFFDDIVFHRFVERNLQLAIDGVGDICRHIVSVLELPEPESYGACFNQMITIKPAPLEQVKVWKSMMGFRNLLVHGYENIDYNIVYDVYENHLGDIGDFLTWVEDNFL